MIRVHPSLQTLQGPCGTAARRIRSSPHSTMSLEGEQIKKCVSVLTAYQCSLPSCSGIAGSRHAPTHQGTTPQHSPH